MFLDPILLLQVCYLGGVSEHDIGTCPGPCDLKAIQGGFANYDSPDKPAAVYRRGQRIRIKYQRNNHGPGGFVRLTLVAPRHMMNKTNHARNAFHWSCFGANVHVVRPREKLMDKWGFSLVGNDGRNHKLRRAYYLTYVRLPAVVPDGSYVLGWAWFGGTGGPVTANKVQKPSDRGYFGDYWSCSFIEVRGGVPLKGTHSRVFQNDMQQFSRKGCMSANDAPGVCTYEPCIEEAFYRRPHPFINGKKPPVLTERQFK